MKFIKTIVAIAFTFSVQAFAHNDNAVPEFFYQPNEGQTAVEVGADYVGYADDNLEAETSLSASASYGILHGVALNFGLSYTFEDNNDGANNFDLDVIAHRNLGALTLHYGFHGSLTPSRTSSNQRFSQNHTFNPYLGVSMGDHCKYGANLTYVSVTADGDVWGNANYIAALFGEWGGKSGLTGVALNYEQVSGSDFDNLRADLYGRIYMGSMTIVPKFFYRYALETDLAEDSYGLEVAARFKF